MNLIPGLNLRVSQEAEAIGIDESEMGQVAYDFRVIPERQIGMGML